MEYNIYQYPVLLQWDQGPEELKKLKYKLQVYFGSKSRSGGGECEIRDTDCTRGYILIYYKDKEAPQRVVQKSPHELVIDGTRFSLRVSLPDAVNTQKMGNPLSSLVASSDGASGSSADEDQHQEDNQNPERRKRENSSMTNSDFRNGDQKRGNRKDRDDRDDSTRHREREKDRRDVGAPEGEEKDNDSSTPRSLTDREDQNPEGSAIPRNDSGRHFRRLLSKKGKSRPADHPEDGAYWSSADKDYQPVHYRNSDIQRKGHSSWTDPGLMDGFPTRPEDDFTRQGEQREDRSDIGIDRNIQYNISFAPRQLRENGDKSRGDFITVRNESRRNSLGRPTSMEEPRRNRPAAPPEDDGTSGSSVDAALFGTVTNPSLGVHEMKIGSVTYQVKTGDITKEETDVIVNSSNRDFTLRTGVSKAILEAAGSPIASSAVALGSRPHKGYVITGSGKLRQCMWILHVTGPNDPKSTKKIVLDALHECENLQASSVTFPDLGTGAGRLPVSTVADSILDSLVEFIKSKSVRSLQTVKVVLFQQNMLNDFYTSMKKRERTVPETKSLFIGLSGGQSLTLPSHWKTMDKTLVMEVEVTPGTPEYTAIQQKFQKSCRNQILKILRVQNRDLWFQYQIKKQNIDSKNGSTTNERELFHGTDFNSIQHVNHHGFNRSHAGKNAAVYGNGTYFAVNANYSASNTYSKPDGNGQRHMYLARVLTGLYCVGQQGMMIPPAKNPANLTDLYDSVTDNVQNPSMFVIFNDIQAYPEYHIIFQ